MIIYIFFLPNVEAPDWCNHYVKEELGGISRTDFFMDCIDAGFPYSQLPTMGPFFTCWIDVLCVCYFFFNRWYKRRWKVITRNDTFANIAMIIIFAVSIIDLIYAIITLS